MVMNYNHRGIKKHISLFSSANICYLFHINRYRNISPEKKPRRGQNKTGKNIPVALAFSVSTSASDVLIVDSPGLSAFKYLVYIKKKEGQ